MELAMQFITDDKTTKGKIIQLLKYFDFRYSVT